MTSKGSSRGAKGGLRLSGVTLVARAPLGTLMKSGAFSLCVFICLYFLIGLTLAQARFSQAFSPLSVAFVAAAACAPMYKGRRFLPTAALAGALAGYLIAGDATDGLKYCAAAILAFSAGTIFRDAPLCRRWWFPPVCAGFGLAATNTVFIIAAEPSLRETLLYICEIALCGAAAYFYTPLAVLLRDPREEKSERPPNRMAAEDETARRRAFSAGALSLVIAFAGFTPFAGMSIGRMAALYFTLRAAARDPFHASAAGLMTGLALDAVLPGSGSLAVIYGVSGLFAGCFKSFGSFWLVIAFTCAHAAALPWLWAGAPMSALYECFAAGVIFFISAGTRQERPRLAPAEGIYDAALGGQLKRLTSAFATVGNTVRFKAQRGEMSAPQGIFTLAIERVCRGCPRSELCWRRDYGATRAALNEAAERIRQNGRAVCQDFPPHFSARCGELAEFVSCVNEFLALRDSRARYRQRAEEDIRLLCAQYDAVTQVLEEVSENYRESEEDTSRENRELRRMLSQKGIALSAEVGRSGGCYSVLLRAPAGIAGELLRTVEDISTVILGRVMRASVVDSPEGVVLRQMEAFRATVGVGLSSKQGEEECGDSTAYFRAGDGLLYLVLSDGMGSGGGAARESAGLVEMLKGFLESGVSVPAALKLLNPAYTIKNEGENFATCDIMRVNLYTGEAECYKCGAAPTYICKAGEQTVKRINSASMPVGLPSPEPDADFSKLQLGDGDTAVLVSDGICEGEDDRWLTAILMARRYSKPSELAGLILREGMKRRADDDMSVLVLRLNSLRD